MSIQVDLNSNNNVQNAKKVIQNPFTKADTVSKRLKLLAFGTYSTGKTFFALQFPNPCIIDMEDGSDYYGEKISFYRKKTTSSLEVNETIDYLLYNDHEFKTLILDPVTMYWEDLQSRWMDYFLTRERVKNPKAMSYTLLAQDWQRMKDDYKRLFRKLINLDMNVILIAREKPEYAQGEYMKVTGKNLSDSEKSTPYVFDLVLNTMTEDTFDPINNKILKTEYKAIVEKDRTFTFKKGDKIDLDYNLFKEKFGFESLNKKAQKVDKITDEQIATINQLVIDKGVSSADLELAKRNYEIDDWSDLTFVLAEKVIGNLKKYSKKA